MSQSQTTPQDKMMEVLRQVLEQEQIKPDQLADNLRMTSQMVYLYLAGGQRVGRKGLERLLAYAPQYSLAVVGALAGLSPTEVVAALMQGPHRQIILNAQAKQL